MASRQTFVRCASGIRTRVWLLLLLAGLFLFGCGKTEPKAADKNTRRRQTDGGVEMVLIPGGWFQMGSDREDETDETPHRVYVSPFWMDKYEVTQQAYERVMGKGTNPSRWKAQQNPAEQIRWAQAVKYCNARSRAEGLQPAYDLRTWTCDFQADGYRLPTEVEWEFAARANTDTAYHFGNSPSELKRYAWFKQNSTRGPSPVGEKEPNPWGLYDMYGNVWEWCHDLYAEDYYHQSPEKDPRGPDTGENRVIRGGCWNSRPSHCRSSYRNYENPGYTDVCFGRDTHGFVGFRCVRKARPAVAAL